MAYAPGTERFTRFRPGDRFRWQEGIDVFTLDVRSVAAAEDPRTGLWEPEVAFVITAPHGPMPPERTRDAAGVAALLLARGAERLPRAARPAAPTAPEAP